MWEYMAPEIVKGEKHEMSVDYYSLGIIANELMFGPNKRPYQGEYAHDMKRAFRRTTYSITEEDIPEGWSSEAADFIN